MSFPSGSLGRYVSSSKQTKSVCGGHHGSSGSSALFHIPVRDVDIDIIRQHVRSSQLCSQFQITPSDWIAICVIEPFGRDLHYMSRVPTSVLTIDVPAAIILRAEVGLISGYTRALEASFSHMWCEHADHDRSFGCFLQVSKPSLPWAFVFNIQTNGLVNGEHHQPTNPRSS